MSSSTNKIVCQATLANGSISVSRVVVVDVGFTKDLILQLSDIEDLQLGPPLSRMSLESADRSLVCYDVYAPLTLTLALTDGSSVSCEMTPQVLVRPPDEVPVVEVEEDNRIENHLQIAFDNLSLAMQLLQEKGQK